MVLAAALVLTVVGYAAGRGLGDPSIPSGDVALIQDVPNEDVTQDDYDTSLVQAAASQGLKSVPAEGSPQFKQVQTAAIGNLIIGRWIEGEADERGIVVSDSQVDDQLAKFRQQNGLKTEKQFEQALKQAKFTPDQAKEQIRLQLLSDQVQKAILPTNDVPDVSDDEVKTYYDANIAQFKQPETRDFRLILNKDKAQVEAAAAALAKDDSASNWSKIAKQYSTDPTSKGTGGLRAGVSQGASEPSLDAQVFNSPTGQLVGPFSGENGYYLIEVEKITPAETTPLDKQLTSQIRQQLQSLKQQQLAQDFQIDFTTKWTSRTFCTDVVVEQQCANFTPPSSHNAGDAWVASTRPVAPGHATVFGPAQGLVQGPVYPAVSTTTSGGLPGSVVPSGSIPPGSSTGAPPAATQGGAPATGAPSGSGG